MCNPIAIAATTAAVSAGSAIVGFMGQSQQASSQRTADRLNFAGDYNALAQRNVEISAASSEDRLSAYIENLKSAGRISAGAGSLGIGAQTAQQLLSGATFDNSRDAEIRDRNTNAQTQATDAELKGAFQSRNSKLAAHAGPTPGELVFGLAKAGLKGVSAYQGAGGKF